MDIIEHFVCEKKIVTLRDFKYNYELTDLDVFKLVANGKSRGYFIYDDFKFKPVFKYRSKQEIAIDKVSLLQNVLKPYTEKLEGRSRYTPWIFSDGVPGELTPSNSKKAYILEINGEEYTPNELRIYTGLAISSISNGIRGFSSVKLNGVYIKINLSDKKDRVYEITTIKTGKKKLIASLSEMSKFYRSRLDSAQYSTLSGLKKDESMELPKIIIERIR